MSESRPPLSTSARSTSLLKEAMRLVESSARLRVQALWRWGIRDCLSIGSVLVLGRGYAGRQGAALTHVYAAWILAEP